MGNSGNYSNIKLNEDLRSLLEDIRRDVFLSLKCHDIGKIIDVDLTNQMVRVEIQYPKTNFVPNPNATSAAGTEHPTYVPKLNDYPLLIDVPFITLYGGVGGLKMPIQAGDFCILLYNDRSMDDWYISGQKAVLSDNRLHSMADAVALVGLRSSKTLYSSYDNDRVSLFYDQTVVEAGAKVKIQNSSQNLNSLLQSLISKVQELVTQTSAITVTCAAPGNPSSVPINKPAIDAISSELSTIATNIGELLE